MEQERIQRYKSQSSRYLASALREIRGGHRQRAEELLWGSLMGAVKAVALSRGVELKSDEEMKSYVGVLAGEARDGRIGDAFTQLSNFSSLSDRIQDSRLSPDRLYHLAERVSHTVEKLWEMLPADEKFNNTAMAV